MRRHIFAVWQCRSYCSVKTDWAPWHLSQLTDLLRLCRRQVPGWNWTFLRCCQLLVGVSFHRARNNCHWIRITCSIHCCKGLVMACNAVNFSCMLWGELEAMTDWIVAYFAACYYTWCGVLDLEVVHSSAKAGIHGQLVQVKENVVLCVPANLLSWLPPGSWHFSHNWVLLEIGS